MQVTSLLSRDEHAAHDHAHDTACPSCGHDHEHMPVGLTQTVIGLVFVINAFIVEWALEHSSMVADASAMIGAILLG